MKTVDALVLGGGGILGEAWMTAVLAGLEESGGFDARACTHFVGTSAGSIVAAPLSAAEAPHAPVARAVEASCAIPGYFQPVVIDRRTYVDGGAWSPTNMDVLPAARGARVLCLNPTGSLGSVLGPLSRSVAAVEALA